MKGKDNIKSVPNIMFNLNEKSLKRLIIIIINYFLF